MFVTQEGNGCLGFAKLVGKIPHLQQFASNILERDTGRVIIRPSRDRTTSPHPRHR